MEVPLRETVVRARSLRRRMSLPEVMLWRAVRRGAGGYKFRRQHPAGRYVIDFYCSAVRLGVELDGVVHEMGDNPQRDEQRDAWLNAHGVTILRLPASEILNDVEASMKFILAACDALSPPPASPVPLPVPGRIC